MKERKKNSKVIAPYIGLIHFLSRPIFFIFLYINDCIRSYPYSTVIGATKLHIKCIDSVLLLH